MKQIFNSNNININNKIKSRKMRVILMILVINITMIVIRTLITKSYYTSDNALLLSYLNNLNWKQNKFIEYLHGRPELI